ncbi:MAG: hypothetical protein AB1304_00535 [Bacteroidota bacterium]
MIILVRCKKYPENSLFLVPPETIVIKWNGLKLKTFKVDGNDSIPLIKQKFSNLDNYKLYSTKRTISSIYTVNSDYKLFEGYPELFLIFGDKSSEGNYATIVFSDDKKRCYFECSGICKGSFDILKITYKEFKIRGLNKNKMYEIYFSK